MDTKVIPFTASMQSNGTSNDVAKQIESLIKQQNDAGWEFVSCGNIDTTIAGSNGCFGVGAKPATNTSVMVLVFKK